MKLLVVGSAGQLSRSLVERSTDRSGIDLVAIGRPEVDLERPETVAHSIAAASADLVINAAAYTAVDLAEDEPGRAFAVNAAGAGEVARAAAEAGAPVIHISTDYVFDGRSSGRYREDDPTNPLGVYGRSKLEGEWLVRAANPDHLIIRTSWVYSPFGSNFVKTMLRLAADRDEVAVVDDQRGCPTSAPDLADALLTVAEHIRESNSGALGRTFHLAGPDACSWADFAEAIFAVSAGLGGPTANVRRIPTSEFPTKAVRPANSALDSSAFEREFGFALPQGRSSLEAALERMLHEGARR